MVLKVVLIVVSLLHPTEKEKNAFYQTMNSCSEYNGNLEQVLGRFEVICIPPKRDDEQYVNDYGNFTGNVYEMWLPEMRKP